MNTLWGIDLGGTKIECAVLDAADIKKVLIRRRIPTEADRGYEHILSQIEKLVGQVIEELGDKPEKIGFATPGTLDPVTQTMRGCNTVAMNGQPMKKDLEARLGVRCELANDANCFALAEALMGAGPAVAPDAQVIFGVILGTGVGGGVVINGKVWGGRQGIGGEWGHIFLDETGGPCYCGNTGCVEKVIAGPALQAWYEKLSGEKRSLAEIIERRNTDPHAAATIERLLDQFGKAISIITNLLDPDLIVLGGGVSNVDFLYTEGLERAQKHVFTPKPDILVVRNVLGDSAGVFGAALLFA
ncbi:ROK family protein [Siphonobacter aquaeclarae]|uniref:N-acetylglucosamine kinase n=1 Tax=Siphonobacter aquaeclarae TaxID=563176 RepID=A0A1G9XJN2_9BACT|nr:ROK family protein [Siphonobacter aquaeclarae]SDM96958.1 N-acetylglucosamine kinase [Siphonobacter aquaeclarae]